MPVYFSLEQRPDFFFVQTKQQKRSRFHAKKSEDAAPTVSKIVEKLILSCHEANDYACMTRDQFMKSLKAHVIDLQVNTVIPRGVLAGCTVQIAG